MSAAHGVLPRARIALLSPLQILGWTLVAVLVLGRAALAAWAGQFGPDEAILAARAREMLAGEVFPLFGLVGNRGVPYGPYPTYFLGAIYGLTGFHLGAALVVFSQLLVASCALLAWGVRRLGAPLWTLLLALSSPLQITYSLALWDNTFLIPLSAAVIGLLSERGGRGRELLIGVLLGVCLAVHLQAVPFAAGVWLWIAWDRRRVRPVAQVTGGALAALAPYALGLWAVREQLAPSLRRVDEVGVVPNLPLLASSVFRFIGAQPVGRISVGGMALFLEDRLVQISVVAWGLLLAAACTYLWLRRRELKSGLLAPLLVCIACYMPFTAATNAVLPNYSQSFWWVAPVLAPVVLSGLLPRRWAGACLALLVGLNLLTTAVQHSQRAQYGSTAELTTLATEAGTLGLGPSWWTQQETVEELCAFAAYPGQPGAYRPTVVRLMPVRHIDTSLPALTEVYDRDCARALRWAPPGQEDWDIVVEPDPGQHFLRTAVAPGR